MRGRLRRFRHGDRRAPFPPPGPVASSYKTLTEVEPRIAINAANTPGDVNSLYKITQPGSYYLTGNITGVANKIGIYLAADRVTIDFAGFSVVGVANSRAGVYGAGPGNITLRNGHVTGWGQAGIYLTSSGASSGGVIESVVSDGNTGSGFISGATVIRGCVASDNGSSGFETASSASLVNCTSARNGYLGFNLSSDCSLTGCTARSNGGTGFSATSDSTFSTCTASNNGGNGFFCQYDCVYTGCTSSDNTCTHLNTTSATGVYCTGGDNRVEANHSRGNQYGFLVTGTGNFITRNTASANASNWGVVSGNVCFVVAATTSGAVTGDSGGVSPGSTNPNANYTH